MIAEYKERVAFRLSTEERWKIEQIIRKGRFRILNGVIRAARNILTRVKSEE